MKIQTLCSVVLVATTAAISLSATPTYSQTESNKVTFFCRDLKDNASNEKIPTTVAWIPERQVHIQIVGWKSQYFEEAGWDGAKRCQEVTSKFQKFYEAGSLNYLTTGSLNNQPVICAVSNTNGQCNSDNLLFTIKLQDHPELVLESLMAVLQGKARQVFYQSSDNQEYISMSKYLQEAPAIDGAMSPD